MVQLVMLLAGKIASRAMLVTVLLVGWSVTTVTTEIASLIIKALKKLTYVQ